MSGMRRAETDKAQADLLRQFALGAFLRVRRGREGLSVETMVERAGLSHMTWRRLEDGYQARPKTYAAVESVFGLPAGSLTRALSDDAALVELAGHLGVDTSAASDSADPDAVRRFLMSFAGSSRFGGLPSGDMVDVVPVRVEPALGNNPVPVNPPAVERFVFPKSWESGLCTPHSDVMVALIRYQMALDVKFRLNGKGRDCTPINLCDPAYLEASRRVSVMMNDLMYDTEKGCSQ